MTSNDNHIRGDGEDMADDNDHAAAAAVCAGGGGAEIGFIRIHWFSLNMFKWQCAVLQNLHIP